MIIGTSNKLMIGEIRNDGIITDEKGVIHKDVAFMVVREATVEEYIAFVTSMGFGGIIDIPRDSNFYEISID